ncbi:MAG: hypothetical protein IPM72_07855 [Chitinophagaceae bacterium]|nr:hypothetical protein [Chitinophagaceae bacterium]
MPFYKTISIIKVFFSYEKYIIPAFLFFSFYAKSQSSADKIVEGSKTLVELIKVIKTPSKT